MKGVSFEIRSGCNPKDKVSCEKYCKYYLNSDAYYDTEKYTLENAVESHARLVSLLFEKGIVSHKEVQRIIKGYAEWKNFYT